MINRFIRQKKEKTCDAHCIRTNNHRFICKLITQAKILFRFVILCIESDNHDEIGYLIFIHM